MPDPTVTITLHLNAGTLYATPDAGHLRADHGATVRLTANFPFRVEFTTLTGTSPPPSDGAACSGAGPGYSFILTLPPEADGTAAPSYKYTIKGDGEAAGKVLDPIIIVDKKPGH